VTNSISILLCAMAMTESGLDPRAYNHRERAVGMFQIRPAAVVDINRHFGTSYRLWDFRDSTLSAWAVRAYAHIYGAQTPEAIARTWNGGPDGAGEASTRGYWRKVKQAMVEIDPKSTSMNRQWGFRTKK